MDSNRAIAYLSMISCTLLDWIEGFAQLLNIGLVSKELYYTYFSKRNINILSRRNLEYVVTRYYGFINLIHYENFLIKNKLCLSGSLLLQVILGKYWMSDMDLYKISNEEIEKVDAELSHLNYYEKYSDRINKYDEEFCTDNCEKSVIKVKNYVHNKYSNIQIIYVKDSIETCVNNFDFDFLRSIYKPENSLVVLYIPECTLKSILTRSSTVNMNVIIREFSSYGKLKVSVKRPSDKIMNDINNMKLYLQRKLDTLNARILKYKVRGFNVEITVDYLNLDKSLNLLG
jgi:hypothetical protein